jgi:hypothetical protein
MELKAELQQLHEHYESELATYAWAREDDRWGELVFCLLHQCSKQEPELTRSAVAALQSLSLIDVGKMLYLNTATHENRVMFAYVLRQHGFSNDDVERACRLLAHVANVVQHNYGGKIQRYLRRHGEVMRDELVSAFNGTSLNKSQMAYAISHWLQNVLSLPISLENDAVIKFCQNNKANLQDLWHAADELDLNIAVVDDLLEIDQRTKEAASEDQAHEEGRS